MGQIDFINASLWYGEVIALNEVSFKITPGITGLVGSNGAGKTSSIKLATSLLKPTLGEVNFNGDPVWQNYEYLRQLGYSPEIDRQFNFMTGRKFLEFAGKLHKLSNQDNQNSVNDILKIIGMRHAADRKISEYSRGMRQRIKIGQSLIHNPSIIFADEPLSGTDPIGRKLMIDLFHNLSKDDKMTIVVSSHVLHELERISEKIIFLDSGKLVAEGKVKDVRYALQNVPQKIKIISDNSKDVAKSITHLVKSIEIIDSQSLIVEVTNRSEFTAEFSSIISNNKLNIFEYEVLDEDLTSVFKLIKNKNN